MSNTESADSGYPVGSVARRLGVSPATLRDWDRRYGIGPSGRTPGGHRRYAAADLQRIELMRRLMIEGMAPAEAARTALADDLVPAGLDRTSDLSNKGSGGRSVPLTSQLPRTRGLARAVLALDAVSIASTMRQTLDEYGVIEAWSQVAAPVLVAIGERSALTGTGIELEHLLSAQLQAVFDARAGALSQPHKGRTVVLACADGDLHSLPLHVLAAALAELGVSTTMLGPRTPPSALAAAVSRVGPAALVVWSQTAGTGDPAQLEGLPTQRPAPLIMAAGPGWWDIPRGAAPVTDLRVAVGMLARVTGND